MKPWVLNILACPLDKYHPLRTYFFSWENTDAELEELLKSAGHPKEELEGKYKLLSIQLNDGTISHQSMEFITDRSGSRAAETLRLQMVHTLQRRGEKTKEELDIIHTYMNMIEVKEGLLLCNKCTRWYPIGNNVGGVPELLPDELREKEQELEWLNKWSLLAPLDVINGKLFV